MSGPPNTEIFGTLRLSAHLVLILGTLFTGTLAGQTPSRTLGLGLGGGLALHSGPPDVRRLGLAAAAFASWPTTSRIALRLDALVSTFGKSGDVIYAPCPPEPPETPCSSSSGSLTVGALVAALRWDDATVTAGKSGSYLILGGGLYRALSSSRAPGATRVGWTAGFGFVVSGAAPRVALEARYHQIPRWPSDRLSIIPITLTLSR